MRLGVAAAPYKPDYRDRRQPCCRQARGRQIARATGGSGHFVTDPSEIHSVSPKAILQAGSRS